MHEKKTQKKKKKKTQGFKKMAVQPEGVVLMPAQAIRALVCDLTPHVSKSQKALSDRLNSKALNPT